MLFCTLFLSSFCNISSIFSFVLLLFDCVFFFFFFFQAEDGIRDLYVTGVQTCALPISVLQWLVEAAEQLRAFSAYFLCDLHLEQLQLDELYAVLRELKAGEISDEEAMKRLERSPYWVWTVMDPTSKLLVVVDVGRRTLAMAQRVVHQVTEVLAPGYVPLFLTDGLKHYATALLTHFGQW